MPLQITNSKVVMIALEFQEPIRLAFLEFHAIPRVIMRLDGLRDGVRFEGIGEASIDFPFVGYDLWDVYWCLSGLNLDGFCYANEAVSPTGSADHCLPPLPFSAEQMDVVAKYPAALTALTMASDDLWAKAHGRSLAEMTSAQPKGLTSWTIGFCDTTEDLHQRISRAWQLGTIPKIKLGRSVREDAALCHTLASAKIPDTTCVPKLSADFNASYTMAELEALLSQLDRNIIDKFVFFEQPLKTNESSQYYARLPNLMRDLFDWQGSLVADESVITQQEALDLAALGWSINYKMQKIGGIRQGMKIEEKTDNVPGMVGGTLPTAIGRAYDLWAGASLSSCSLPSDAWLPSTEWFSGDNHLIQEEFSIDSKYRALPFKGTGLGITPNWEKIERLTISNPKNEYLAIRSDRPATCIDFRLRDGRSYSECYRDLSGLDPHWNL